MRWLRSIVFLSLALGPLGVCAPTAFAAAPKPISYDLYSWPKGNDWHFSIFEGTRTVRSLETIQDRKVMLRGVSYLKGRLASLRPKDVVYWRERPASGLRLPPEEVVQDLLRFINGMQVILVLPKDKPDPYPSLPPD